MKKLFFLEKQKINCFSSFYRYFLMFLLAGTFVACGEQQEENNIEEPLGEETAVMEDEDEWNYENVNWAEGGNLECATKVQSPIDILPEDAIEADLPEIEYEFEPFDMTIVDTGHGIQVLGSQNNGVTIDDTRYEFLQMHFHAPSEHTLEGEAFPLELHLVHRAEGSDNLAVLGVFIQEGEENSFIEDVFAEIPEEDGTEVQTAISLNLTEFIPEDDTYYTYIGSLTTPPCTVGVTWFVFGEPITATAEQIQVYTDLYDNTARPVQPLNNRRVFTPSEL